ncbi:hypothetical protein G6F61_014206 [Rhizopus arrhizus]|nr:hypothetical protein G6F61_014206 [Rhizopus arrhizus]
MTTVARATGGRRASRPTRVPTGCCRSRSAAPTTPSTAMASPPRCRGRWASTSWKPACGSSRTTITSRATSTTSAARSWTTCT